MKKLLFITIISLCASLAFSQDLIITNKGDSIQCNISGVKKGNYYFSFLKENELRTSLIPESEVQNCYYDFYNTGILPPTMTTYNDQFSHFRFAINGGVSYMTAPVAKGLEAFLEEYIRQLKSGYNYGVDIAYFFTEYVGICINYYNFSSKNFLSNIYVTNEDGTTTYGNLSDKMNISFIGPGYVSRIANVNNNAAFIASLSLGYVGYYNDREIIEPYTMKGNTVGMMLQLGYEFEVSSSIYCGFQLSSVSAVLSSYDWIDENTTTHIQLDQDQLEGLNRIDISVGLRFTL